MSCKIIIDVRIFHPNFNFWAQKTQSFLSGDVYRWIFQVEKIPILTSLYQALSESERKRQAGKLVKLKWKTSSTALLSPVRSFTRLLNWELDRGECLLTSDNVTRGTTTSFLIGVLVAFKSNNYLLVKLISDLLLGQVWWSRCQSPCHK